MSIKLSHTAVNMVLESKVFENVSSVDSMVKTISKVSKKLFPDDEDTRKKFCGNAFEVFVEYFMNTTSNDNRIGVSSYHQFIGKDLGVDGIGLGFDGNPAVVQAKFRENWSEVLPYRELATFGNDALSRFLIISEGSAEAVRINLRKKGVAENILEMIKNTMHNVFVITTAREVSYHWDTVNKGGRFIGYNELKQLTDDMPNFWNWLRESIFTSRSTPKKRFELQRYDHQKRMIKAVSSLLADPNNHRGQVICATGGGKTLVQVDSAKEVINKHNGKIIVMLSPRISLTRQHIKEFDKNQPKEINFNLQCICSGDDIIPEGYENNNAFFGKIEPTCSVEKVKEWVLFASNKFPLVICCTYHSAKKIREACLSLKRDVDLVICDEAHNMTAQNFNLILDKKSDCYIPAKKWLFFTATRKTDYSGDGRGMNNTDRFGEIISKVLPNELIEAGVILPPRIRVCQYNPNMYIDENSEEELRINIAMICAGVRAHEHFYFGESRVIISCGNAVTEPKGYMKSEVVQRIFPNYYMAAVTSDYCIEKNVGESHFTTANRDEVFKKFAEHTHSLMFHYDVVGEGIDFPGVTGLLPLRALGNIKVIQSIGRTLRLHPIDRDALALGTITTSDRSVWCKPFGEFILPMVNGKNEDDTNRMYYIVKSLMSEGFNVDAETFTNVSELAKGTTLPKSDELDELNEKQRDIPQFSVLDIEEIIKKVEEDTTPFAKETNERRIFIVEEHKSISWLIK